MVAQPTRRGSTFGQFVKKVRSPSSVRPFASVLPASKVECAWLIASEEGGRDVSLKLSR